MRQPGDASAIDREKADDRRPGPPPTRRLRERTVLEASVYEFGPVVFPAYKAATAGASTGGHPPSAPPRSKGMTSEEFVRLLSKGTSDTPEAAAARRRWLDKVLPLPDEAAAARRRWLDKVMPLPSVRR